MDTAPIRPPFRGFVYIALVEPNLTVSSPGYASRAQKTAGEFPRRIVSRRNAGPPLDLHRALHSFRRDRQRSDAGAAGVEDGITDRRRHHGHRRLADAGRLLAVSDHRNRDLRHLAHTERGVGVEVSLVDAAVL